MRRRFFQNSGSVVSFIRRVRLTGEASRSTAPDGRTSTPDRNANRTGVPPSHQPYPYPYPYSYSYPYPYRYPYPYP